MGWGDGMACGSGEKAAAWDFCPSSMCCEMALWATHLMDSGYIQEELGDILCYPGSGHSKLPWEGGA